MAWFWATIATIILGIPVMVAGLLSCTGNLTFSISKLWAYIMLALSFVRTEIKNKNTIRNIFINRFNTTRAIESINKGIYRLPRCRHVMRKGSFTLKPEKIQIVIGDPIDTVQELIDKMRQAIIANFDPEYIP